MLAAAICTVLCGCTAQTAGFTCYPDGSEAVTTKAGMTEAAIYQYEECVFERQVARITLESQKRSRKGIIYKPPAALPAHFCDCYSVLEGYLRLDLRIPLSVLHGLKH